MRLMAGVEFQTDLLALLPQEERDPAVQRAKTHVGQGFGRRIVIAAGHADRAKARAAASSMAQTLRQSGLTETVTDTLDGDALRKTGEIFFPYRFGLVTQADRARLEQGR